MVITLNIQADTPEELQEAITGLANVTAATTTVTTQQVGSQPTNPKQEKTKRGAAPKAEKEQVKEETPTKTTEPETIEGAPSVSVVELREKAQEKGKTAEGKKAIKALLEKFESKSISSVPEEKRAEFLVALEGL